MEAKWDGNINRDSETLIKIGFELSVRTHRCCVIKAIALLTSIANGETDFGQICENSTYYAAS